MSTTPEPADLEQEDIDIETNSNGSTDDTSALIGQIKDIRKKIAKGDFKKDLPIPGYGNLLVARFRPYAIAKSERKSKGLRDRAERDEPFLLDASCDTLIDACEQIMVQKPGWDEPRPIDDEMPIKFDARLAELLDIELPERGGARAVVKALFPTEQSIIATSIEVTRWLNTVSGEVNEEALGE